MFQNKILLITGGTGSFGNAILRHCLDSDLREIRVFSRDEKKQDDLRKRYASPKLKFFIGDVRDKQAVTNVVRGVDFIFHAAALKQVPSCEFHPLEAVKTNVLGTENVLDSAIHFGVQSAVVLSTDKAVYPINAMGISKAMMEKVAIAKSRNSENTKITITRYGNVMGSRGSVIPLFASQIREKQPLSITDPNMTRFMMSLDDAVNLVTFAFNHGKSGDIFVQKAPACTISTLAKAIYHCMGENDYPTEIIGTRHGEKLFEVLLSREEMSKSEDLGNYFRISPDHRDLNYSKFIDKGELGISQSEDYNSHNTQQLNVSEMIELLSKLKILNDL